LTLVAFAFVTISPHRKEQVEEFEYFVSSKDEIYSCHIVSGASDYMLEIVASDMDQYTIFIKEQLMELNCVASVESNFSMSCIKKKSSISKLIMHEKI
jgi:Lrp/AsnC family leucine-responsive transcriptional regulator